jgi:hypothetical protein
VLLVQSPPWRSAHGIAQQAALNKTKANLSRRADRKTAYETVASWVIYAMLGVLVLLIVWRVLEWKHTTDQAANLRTAVFVMGVTIAALVVWHFVPR